MFRYPRLAVFGLFLAILEIVGGVVAYSWLFGDRVGLMFFIPPPTSPVAGAEVALIEDALYNVEGRYYLVEEGMEITLRFEVDGEPRSLALVTDREGKVVVCVGCFGVGERVRPGLYFVWWDATFDKFEVVPFPKPSGWNPVPPQNGLG